MTRRTSRVGARVSGIAGMYARRPRSVGARSPRLGRGRYLTRSLFPPAQVQGSMLRLRSAVVSGFALIAPAPAIAQQHAMHHPVQLTAADCLRADRWPAPNA